MNNQYDSPRLGETPSVRIIILSVIITALSVSIFLDQLRKLQTLTEIDVFLSGGTVLEDVIFVSFDPNNCCAFFNDNETEPGSVLIVDCQSIQAIRIEAD